MRRLATLVLVTTLAAPSTALAQTTGSDVVEAVAVGIGISVGTAFSVVAGVGGTVTLIGSSVQLSRDRPTLGWSIASFIVGPLAALIGGGMVAATFDAGLAEDYPGFVITNGVVAAIGGLNITFAILNIARYRPGRVADEGPSLSLAPVAILDRAGDLNIGAGLRVAGF